MVAVKQIQLEGFKGADVMRLMQDVDLVKQYSHPNIIKYEGVVREKSTLSIVLEYVLQISASFLWLWRVLLWLSL
jgi:serine/threonine protein kinase